MENFTPEEAQQYLVEAQGFTPDEANEYLKENGIIQEKGSLERGLEFLDMPRAGTVSAIAEGLKKLGVDTGTRDVSAKDVYNGKGLTSSEILKSLGVDTLQTMKEAYAKEPNKTALENYLYGEDSDNILSRMRVAAPIELATDITTDPTTYLAGPISQALKGAGKVTGISKMLDLAGNGVKAVGESVYAYPFKKIDAIRELEGYQKLSEMLRELGVSGSWKDIKSALQDSTKKTWGDIKPVYEKMTEAGYRQNPEALAKEMYLPYSPDMSDFDKAQALESRVFADKVVGSKKTAGYSDAVKDWKSKIKNYNKQALKYAEATGKSADQLVLPVADDLERTSEKFIPYEKHGKDPSTLVAEPVEHMTQGELRSLPTKTFDEARSVQGDFMLSRRQTVDAKKALTDAIGSGYQSEILGAHNTPRSYGSAPVKGSSGMSGQLEMIMHPGDKPVRPSKDLSALEVFESKKDVGNAVSNWENLDRAKANEMKARAYGVIKDNLEKGAEKYLGKVESENLIKNNAKYGSLLDALEYTDPNIIKDAGKSVSSWSLGAAATGQSGSLAAIAKEGSQLAKGVKPLTKAGLGIESMADWIKALDSKDAAKLGYILRETARPDGEE